MPIVIVVYPNEFDEGRPWASHWDSREELIEDPQHIKELDDFDVGQLVDGPVIEGIQVLHIHGYHPPLADYAKALRMGFQSQREHEWAVMLDQSWGFDMFVQGELEDESGQYDRQRQEHRERWNKIGQAVEAYLASMEEHSGFAGWGS
jgi:hypothetical protein